MTDKLIFAVPKGRILEELLPLLEQSGITPEADFFDKKSRKLRFTTNKPELDLIRVRSFDVATLVAYGGAQIGVAGSDVLEEFAYENLYAPLDLQIGKCRLSLAAQNDNQVDLETLSHIKVATKYPNLTSNFFAKLGIQAECIKLNGAMEIAPALNITSHIVDLVSTGSTLKANNLAELKTILDVSSKIAVNKQAFKTRKTEILSLINTLSNIIAAHK